PGRIIGLCGCIAEKDKNDIFRKIPFVDFVVGPGQEGNIMGLINKVKKGEHKLVSTGELCGDYPFKTIKREKSTTAYIRIMVGCDNYCSYCIVPYVRGREISRLKEDILEEINDLDKKTYKEVVLLGQNVNSYGKGTDHMFPQLLKDVSGLKGVERIRFFTSHPRDMSDEIIDAVKELPKACEFFHLPLQSGDDVILKRMNRGYTSDHYRKLVDRIRKKIPHAAITSDVVAGFPGETEEQFENTLKLISELELDLVNTFAYSIRQGSAAAKMEGQLPKDVIKDRLQRLMKVVEATVLKRNNALVGTAQEVLVDCKTRTGLSGRTRGNKIVLFEGPQKLIGKLVNMKITGAKAWVLHGLVD
ncbi:tRNA (N6-isopentenyl adenosine(37)-C2)-methylthiotransferase MiaB, partial [Candidatus Margulisiibacteriota bacterium]